MERNPGCELFIRERIDLRRRMQWCAGFGGGQKQTDEKCQERFQNGSILPYSASAKRLTVWLVGGNGTI